MEQKAKILAVEDDIFLKELLAGRFSGGDFEVFHASSGDEALEIAKEEQPKVILLDIILPGMSGFEVLEKLKADESTSSIPVIFLSNLGSEEDIQKGKELGAEDFLVKANNSLDAIVERIQSELDKHTSEGASDSGGVEEASPQPEEGTPEQPAENTVQDENEPEPAPQPETDSEENPPRQY